MNKAKDPETRESLRAIVDEYYFRHHTAYRQEDRSKVIQELETQLREGKITRLEFLQAIPSPRKDWARQWFMP